MRTIRKFRWTAFGVVLLILCGCTRLVPEVEHTGFNAYASFYPIYALTALITDEVPDVRLNCLVQPQDGCLRNYALSDWDGALLTSAADLVVIGGRGLESFEQQLYGLGDEGPAVLTAFADIELYNEAAGQGSEDSSHWETANPHAYMSVELAADSVATIAEALCAFDPEHAEQYKANLARAQAKLTALLTEMRAVAPSAAGQRAILLNEALVYTARDLNLEIDGWYARESGQELSDTEFEAFLEAVSGCAAKVVLVEKQAPASLLVRLKQAGYAVGRVDVLSEGRAELGAEGYFAAQLDNARAIEQAFQEANQAQ